MCLTVYIASDTALPNVNTSHLIVRPINEHEARVERHFSRPKIHFVGAYTGCACGFMAPDAAGDEERDLTLSELVRFLDAHAPNEPLELFVSWVGNEKRPAKNNLAFRRSELAARTDWCEEQTLVALAS